MDTILKKIEQIIDLQMKGKFGLTDEESAKVTSIVSNYWNELISANNFGNQIQSKIQNIKDKSLSINKIDLTDELIKKAGISEEKAKLIKEFSLEHVKEQLKTEFLNEEGKLDWNKISTEAKDIFDKLRKK